MNSGQMSWLKNHRSFTVVDTKGHTIPKPLETLGFVAPVNTLQVDHIYSISGPFRTASLAKFPLNTLASITLMWLTPIFPMLHSRVEQLSLGSPKWYLSTLKMVRLMGPIGSWILWSPCLCFVPLQNFTHTDTLGQVQNCLTFNVVYCFGHATPLGRFWPHITAGSAILVHGNIINKDIETLQFDVMVRYSAPRCPIFIVLTPSAGLSIYVPQQHLCRTLMHCCGFYIHI